MNEMLETLFMGFLEAPHTGLLVAELHRLSALIDQQIEAGDVDMDTVAAYELAACRFAFAGGYAAGMQAAMGQAVKI